ncbi:16S rRNA (cytosine(967)-C(5))-methyltransferase RsmB [Nosocomiicoccus ampullae]|uniref:16S rRNA (cytosine(967)-C(5))-methyltransferase n=1 Tax=Nosocomiicoccus ampullae TaxID=489910 RepID=A0A9Q2CZL5_9STAP|nr:16S rRNA (cytosine(967)-C(5))-methyltransferase RsmB [Nosocomiicoccus ampullae]MBB5176178.1 16S rRNA (cytosine967-C5)-methyltransferase [Nosocomiicoccus ampullae]QYA47346.1 16S rRNA (cytosine(967)-C(5))-methyltransferase RsmB [Nosocomiicoccus ampullae]
MTVRKKALDAYTAVIDDGGYSNLVINKIINDSQFSSEDRALFTEIVYGSISRKLTLEYYLRPFIKTKLKRWQRHLLIVSIYQLEFLDKIPSYAVINEAVEIAKEGGGKQDGNKINAILRSYLREEKQKISDIKNDKKRLSIQYSMPLWIVDHLMRHYSIHEVENILNELLKRPNMYVRVNRKLTSRDELLEKFSREGITALKSDIHENAIIVKGGGITDSNLYREGLFGIQDASSMCVNYALDPSGNELILDACSAPGGKGFHALENMDGHVDFSDIFEHKLTLIDNESKRLKHTNLNILLKDATTDSYDKIYDKIIVDAPCSGLGVVKRKPEIKYNLKKEDIDSLVDIQLSILHHVKEFLKPGGILVYSTCTIHQMENENVAYTFKKQSDDIEFGEFEIPHFKFKGNHRQILPHEFNTDGFFIAKFKKL